MLYPKKGLRANMIILKPREPQQEKARHWETSSTYLRTLILLLNDLNQRRIPTGYESIPVKTTKDFSIGLALNIRLDARYQGVHLRGDILTVTNQSDKTVTLIESEFYQAGDRAISLHDTVLAPHAQTQLIKVSTYE